MIKLERTSVMNMDNAIRGMRNPMNSWDRSDSYSTHIENPETENTAHFAFFMGDDDLDLALRLVRSGSDHRKFMRQIFVSVDITAPLYWWKEYDTYKVGTAANSCSTMHTICARPLTLEDFSAERITSTRAIQLLRYTIDEINENIALYNREDDKGAKATYFDNIIQLLPSSFNQMRTCTLDYENLIGMYHARRNHKLAEWREFCRWAESLPYAEELICGNHEIRHADNRTI